MADSLPTEYDVIVVGTGMVECIFAAACARVGKSVLQLDRNGFYGGDWASFNLDHLQRFVSGEDPGIQNIGSVTVEVNDGERLVVCGNLKTISNVEQEIHTTLNANESTEILNCPELPPPEDAEESDQEISVPEKVNETQSELTNETTGTDKQLAGCSKELPETNETTSTDEQLPGCSKELSGTDEATGTDEQLAGCSKELTTEERSEETTEENAAAEESQEEVTSENSPATRWSWGKIMKEFRKFNLDLSPKLLLSRGELVDLLISSNVSRYAEYKCLTRILTFTDKVEQVPCSRSDVFSTKHISVVDKRMLMKLLTFCIDYDPSDEEHEEHRVMLFKDFMKRRKLSSNVCHYVQHAIAMVSVDATAREGLLATKMFLRSLGRFGNTPFLWPMYGSGELPQCFCRLCAVFGGIFCLRRSIEYVILDKEGNCCGLISENQRLNCKLLVMESSYAPVEFLPDDILQNKISRGILLTDKSLMPSTKEQISLLRFPPKDNLPAVNLVELPPGSMVCPENMHVVHLTTDSTRETAKQDLEDVVDLFFTDRQVTTADKPVILWSLFFNLLDTTKCSLDDGCPNNLLITSNSGSSIHFDRSVIEARSLFRRMYPEDEFLPRAPDPDEIILDSDENPGPEAGGGFADSVDSDTGSKVTSNDDAEDSQRVVETTDKKSESTEVQSSALTNECDISAKNDDQDVASNST